MMGTLVGFKQGVTIEQTEESIPIHRTASISQMIISSVPPDCSPFVLTIIIILHLLFLQATTTDTTVGIIKRSMCIPTG